MEDPLSNLKCSLAEKLDLGKSQQTQGFFMIRRCNVIFIGCSFFFTDVENLNMPQLMPEHTSCKGNYCEDVLVVNAFFHVIKDTSNCLEKVVKISHFNQTK